MQVILQIKVQEPENKCVKHSSDYIITTICMDHMITFQDHMICFLTSVCVFEQVKPCSDSFTANRDRASSTLVTSLAYKACHAMKHKQGIL